VDITLPKRSGVSGFQFQASTDFNGTFNAFQDVPSNGYKSVTPITLNTQDSQFRGLTRFLFDPTDYTASVAAVDDTTPFWVRIAPIDPYGVVGTPETPQMVLPFSSVPNRTLVLSGSVGLTAEELQLPLTANNFNFEVESGQTLYVAFEPNGAEFPMPGVGTGIIFGSAFPTSTVLFLRGTAASTDFQIQARLLAGMPL
jgi:hypothetical protein